jgi:hypothetical protein
MGIKVKILVLLIIVFLHSAQISIACEVSRTTGGGSPCTSTFGPGQGCADVFLPKPSPSSDSILVLEEFGYVNKSSFSLFCGYYTACLASGLLSKDTIEGYGSYWGPGRGSEPIRIIDFKQTAVYKGPECELVIKGRKEIQEVEDKDFMEYVPSCSGSTIEKAFCLRRGFGDLWLPVLGDCTDRYKGRCSEVCGGERGCMGVFPKSIGCCDDYCTHYCLCNENCRAESVNWKDVFKVVYIINGVEFEAKDDITYYAGPNQKLNIKVRVDIRDEYKNKINLQEERIKIEMWKFGDGELLDGEYKIGDEIVLPPISLSNYGYSCRYDEVPGFSYSDGIEIIPSIVKETPMGPYGRKLGARIFFTSAGQHLEIDFPLQSLKIAPALGKYELPCSKIEIEGKQYVTLLNRTVLYDPNWEIWNKCCRDEIIDFSLINVEKVERTNENGVTEESGYKFTFKVKDNRDSICEDLFGKWEFNVFARYTSYINPLLMGSNSLKYEVEVYPGIYVSRK